MLYTQSLLLRFTVHVTVLFLRLLVFSIELCKNLVGLLCPVCHAAWSQSSFSRLLTEWFGFRTVYFEGFCKVFLDDVAIELSNYF